MGYIWKALEKGFSEMRELGGLPEPYFTGNQLLPLTSCVFFLASSGQVSDRLHCTPTHITGCTIFFGGGGNPPPYFWAHKFKQLCFGEGWDDGGDVQWQKYEKMGQDIAVDRTLPKW